VALAAPQQKGSRHDQGGPGDPQSRERAQEERRISGPVSPEAIAPSAMSSANTVSGTFIARSAVAAPGVRARTAAGPVSLLTNTSAEPSGRQPSRSALPAPAGTPGSRGPGTSEAGRRPGSASATAAGSLRLVAGGAKKRVPTPRGAQGQFYCAFYGAPRRCMGTPS
jgi:hypothetical protein